MVNKMHNKMEIYAEILRQIGRMPDNYKGLGVKRESMHLADSLDGKDDAGETDEPLGNHYESQEYEEAEEKGAKMVLGKKAEEVRTKGEKKQKDD